MAVELNHTIVRAHDRRESAEFLADLLGLEVGAPAGPFLPVATSNGVTLDFADTREPGAPIPPQHYAFLVTEDEFDAAFGRIRASGREFFAGPHGDRPGEINHWSGGRGVHLRDPSGHVLELLTRPYQR